MSEKTEPWRDEDRLRELYVNEGMTQSEISDEFGCARSTVAKWMRKLAIETRQGGREVGGPWGDEEVLRELYVNKGMSHREIADELDCHRNTIFKWLQEFDIETRGHGAYNPYEVPYFINFDGYETWTHVYNSEFDRVFIHRLTAVAEHGIEVVSGKQIHHCNHVRWDNRPENLRPVNPSEHGKLHGNHVGFDEDGWPIYEDDRYDCDRACDVSVDDDERVSATAPSDD